MEVDEDVCYDDAIELEDLLAEAMQCVPEDERVEYHEALVKCPDIVATESPATLFLKAAGYDVLGAARKLANYWKSRKLCVGSHKAFLPLTIEGAMADDLEYLGKGIRYDEFERDQFGRTILFAERRRAVQIPTATRLRVYFYQLHRMAHDPMTQEHGIIKLESRWVSSL